MPRLVRVPRCLRPLYLRGSRLVAETPFWTRRRVNVNGGDHAGVCAGRVHCRVMAVVVGDGGGDALARTRQVVAAAVAVR